MLVCYRFCSYTFWLACLTVWCLTLAIHEMTAINEITAKMDHVPFTCNWLIVLQKWAHGCMFLQKRCSENISKCDEVYYQKRIISKSGECALKKNSATIVFLYCDIKQFKILKMPSPQARNQEFFRTGEFSSNYGTLINIHLQHEKERSRREKIYQFFA